MLCIFCFLYYLSRIRLNYQYSFAACLFLQCFIIAARKHS